MKPGLFLDRDGVINHDNGYVWEPSEIRFIDGIFELCSLFARKGFVVIIVTNQSGIARGMYTEAELEKVMQWMSGQFAQKGVCLTRYYYCPHLETITGPCDCRKPQPGMILRGIEDYNIAPAKSLIIGDRERDMEAGRAAGLAKQVLYDFNQHPNIFQAQDWSAIIKELLAQ